MEAETKRRAPRVLTTAKIAKIFGDGWTARRVRKVLAHEGIGKLVGGRYLVTATELRCVLPSLASEIEMAAAEGLE